MINTDKYFEILARHAPSTKKQIYVADTSSGRIENALWHIAMSFVIEVKRLQMYKKAWDKLYEYHNDETELGWLMQELMDKTMKEEEE
tara:strand:+ start:1354 stop:1617 length:264 start_codon:yes stop_codon:yes gene_type:complete